MMNTAAAGIFRKALALKPDGLEGVLNHLDPEEAKLKDLGERLVRRRRYLQDLSTALNSAPKDLDKTPILRMVEPLSETVNKIDTWLSQAQAGLAILNKVVKHQNTLLANAITDFAQKNREAFRTKVQDHTTHRKINFVKAAA
jgi:hypothetical protein